MTNPEQKTIKIDFTEFLDLDMNEENPAIFTNQLVKSIKEILNTRNIEDFYVYKSGDVQEIVLAIRNEKSDH